MKKLPIAISYQMQCLYCGYIESFIARSKYSNPEVEDEQLLRDFTTKDNTIDFCNHCKGQQVFRFNCYYEGE